MNVVPSTLHLPNRVAGTGRSSLRAGRPKRIVVLAYHDVTDAESFGSQVAYLARAMRPVSAQEFMSAQRGDRVLPARAVLVTFDDGDRSVYDTALPILRDHGVPAVLFPIAALVGGDHAPWFREVRGVVRQGVRSSRLDFRTPDEAVRMLKQVPDAERRAIVDELRSRAPRRVVQPQLTTEELREMEAAGFEIGNHTNTHPCLDRCTSVQVAEEVRQAHKALSRWLGRSPRLFAYPNGNADDRAEHALSELGYEAAFLFDHRICRLPASNPMRISRVRVNSTTTMARFRAIVTGVHPLVHHFLGRN